MGEGEPRLLATPVPPAAKLRHGGQTDPHLVGTLTGVTDPSHKARVGGLRV